MEPYPNIFSRSLLSNAYRERRDARLYAHVRYRWSVWSISRVLYGNRRTVIGVWWVCSVCMVWSEEEGSGGAEWITKDGGACEDSVS